MLSIKVRWTSMHANQKPRRRHSEEFKAQVLAACAEPGVSVSAVALSFGLNDNLVHQWRRGRGCKADGAVARTRRCHNSSPCRCRRLWRHRRQWRLTQSIRSA